MQTRPIAAFLALLLGGASLPPSLARASARCDDRPLPGYAIRRPWREGEPVPCGYHVENRVDEGKLIVGGAILTATLTLVSIGVWSSYHRAPASQTRDGSGDGLGLGIGIVLVGGVLAGGGLLLSGLPAPRELVADGHSQRRESTDRRVGFSVGYAF